MPQQTTIFKQLIFNVVVPAFLALILLGALNYNQTRQILIRGIDKQNQLITDEIFNILEFQDLALSLVEQQINQRFVEYSKILVNDIFRSTDNIENADLYKVRTQLGMNALLEDMYIINRDGVIINTTFQNDKNKNLFNFGEDHKRYLLHVFESGMFVSERFAIEQSTRRLRKFTYQPTLDQKYIIELGAYSGKGDEIVQFIKNRLNNLALRKEGIISVDLYMGEDIPFSINNQDEIISQEDSLILKEIFREKQNKSLVKKKEGKTIQYDFIYMDRKNTDLYKSSIVRIVTDRSFEQRILRNELLKFFGFFLLTVIAVSILIYRKTRVITDPIKKLMSNVMRITDGHLNERAEVDGNNEIATLAEKFNVMIEQLESYYYELEEKVRERTAQIQHQKEEIEAQRDAIESQKNILADINANLQDANVKIEQQNKHITDSIHYAKRIQNAILPPDDYLKNVFGNSFILYLPKDIVSGDFYWVAKKNDLLIFAAVDCTGHGVPGAFMSIVGSNQLNYAINVLELTDPSDILNALNQGVTETLRQSRTTTAIRDGMDIALCVADFKNRSLKYSGAFNSLYLVRNGELTEFKADKFPIGSFLDDELPRFVAHTIDLEPNDMLYVCSDGYVDQFGGKEGRKYLIKNFRQLLIRIAGEPIEKQKELLLHEHNQWKGELEQIDDILVVGVRVP